MYLNSVNIVSMNECVNESVCNRKHSVPPNVKKTKQNTKSRAEKDHDFLQNIPVFVGHSMKITMFLIDFDG